jgi:hypothetical protein
MLLHPASRFVSGPVELRGIIVAASGKNINNSLNLVENEVPKWDTAGIRVLFYFSAKTHFVQRDCGGPKTASWQMWGYASSLANGKITRHSCFH